MADMGSNKPYLLRALFEWIVDNQCTPHLLVAAHLPNVRVPEGFVEDGQMVLNIAPSAVRNFTMSNEAVSFEARFSGMPHSIYVPVYAIAAIYARENGQGMAFELDRLQEEFEPAPLDETEPQMAIAEWQEDGDSQPVEPPPRAEGRPSLKVIK